MSKKLPVTQRLWIEIDGSVYVKEEDDMIPDFTRKVLKVRTAIAFNVGSTVARHIVKIHNDSILVPIIGAWGNL